MGTRDASDTRTEGAHAPMAGAHVHWDAQWRAAEGIVRWTEPEPQVVTLAEEAHARGGRRALDVGCGVGRHALALAELGLESHAIDLSEAGIAQLNRAAPRRGLTVHTAVGHMTSLPYPSGTFDLVVAWNVVYHGIGDDVVAALSEITRVLRPSGRYIATMLSKRNTEFGKGREISPDVFVQDDGPDDKAYPHLYCDLADIVRLHPGLTVLSAVDREHRRPGSFHWHLTFEKPISGRRARRM